MVDRRFIRISLAASLSGALSLSSLSACATATSPAPTGVTPAPGTTAAARVVPRLGATPAADARWADSVLATLSLRDKAAQMVWPWILGDYTAVDNAAWTRVERLIREQKLGGAIISVGGPIDIAVKTNALQRAASLPLLIGADLETGAAFRARGGYFVPNAIDLGGATAFPYQMGIGATRDTMLAYQMGRVTALEGRALGIHMAFAPVLDVNNNPKNPVISARSFGENPQLVARMGTAFIRGIQEHGMLATGKHFPGHGDTEQNSHLELSRVDVSRARLDSVELLPFREAVRAGLRGMMTFHGDLPSLDSSRTAATFSPKVMIDLLRDQMGFKGILVTDALDMNGALGTRSMAEVTQLAVVAGNDVLLMPTDVPVAIEAVVSGVRTGRFTESRVDASVRKLLMAKHELGLARDRFVDVERVRDVVADVANLTPARLAAERAITLVRDSLSMIPLGRLPRTTRMVSFTVAPRAELSAGAAFNEELRSAFPQLRAQNLLPEVVFDATAGASAGGTGTYVASPVPRLIPAVVENALRAAAGSDVVVVSSYFGASSSTATLAATGGLRELLDGLRSAGAKVVLVSFANPYLARDLPATPVFLEAWSGSPLSQRAAARALLGRAPITGLLPVSIPSVAPYGAGLRREVLVAPTP